MLSIKYDFLLLFFFPVSAVTSKFLNSRQSNKLSYLTILPRRISSTANTIFMHVNHRCVGTLIVLYI